MVLNLITTDITGKKKKKERLLPVFIIWETFCDIIIYFFTNIIYNTYMQYYYCL